jgi:hypothetical protein
MGLAAFAMAVFLFVILLVFTFMVAPPSAWLNRKNKR